MWLALAHPNYGSAVQNPPYVYIWVVCGRLNITREMQSINGSSIKVLDSSVERIAFKTFEP